MTLALTADAEVVAGAPAPADPAKPTSIHDADGHKAPPPDPVTLQAAQVRRVSLADIDDLQSWLIPRLMRVYANRDFRTLKSFLTQLLTSNEALFVRNDRAIGLAMTQSRALRPTRVSEMFCFALGHPGRDAVPDEEADSNAEAARFAATLYPAMIAWARGQGLTEVVVLECSDATVRTVEAAIGRTIASSHYRRVMLT